MTFAEKIRELRNKKGLSQTELGKAVGVSLRTVRNWELEGRYPQQREIYRKLADVLDCDVEYLLSEKAVFVAKPDKDSEEEGIKDAERVLAEATSLFSGGRLAEKDKDALLMALQKAYIDGKTQKK